MDENKEKTAGNNLTPEEIHDEMENLAKVFKEELEKAKKEQAEETIEDLEVEGYDPRKVSVDKKNKETTELCEYCGEKPRGTQKNPKSPYCKDCEELLEKYPYDYKGVVACLVILCVVVGAIFCFAVNTPIFATMKKADKAIKDNKLYTAVVEYENALNYVNKKDTEHKFYGLHAKRIEALYRLQMQSQVFYEIDTYLTDSELELPAFYNARKCVADVDAMTATAAVINKHMDLNNVTKDNYETMFSELDKLIGKKVYEKNGEFFDETMTDFTPDGSETVYTADAGWLHITKYQIAMILEWDIPQYIEYLEDAVEATDFMKNMAGYMLGDCYIETKQYDKAEALAKELGKNNKEATDYYLLMSMVKRYRDNDYQSALSFAEQGITVLRESSGGESFVIQYGTPLIMQKGLNYIMLGERDNAIDTINLCCYYLSQIQIDDYGSTMISTVPEAWEICALAALDAGDTKTYETMEENYKLETTAETEVYNELLADYKAGTKTLKDIASSRRYDLV